MATVIRKATPADVEAAGTICFEAFYHINTAHNFPPDIPNAEMAVGFFHMMFSHPGLYCVVAEEDGRIIGSNVMDERSPIFGIGPITIDPAAQNHGVGRALMNAVLVRARERNAPGVRLVQAAFHNRSLSLYTNLGFEVREPLSVLTGTTVIRKIDGYNVRPAQAADLGVCNLLCTAVHGHHRGGDLSDSIGQGTAMVVERGGRITGYTSSMGFFGHAVGATNEDVMALIAATPEFHGPGIFVPSRNSELFRWGLAQGLRVSQPMTLMTIGLYNEPKGAYLTSVMF